MLEVENPAARGPPQGTAANAGDTKTPRVVPATRGERTEALTWQSTNPG